MDESDVDVTRDALERIAQALALIDRAEALLEQAQGLMHESEKQLTKVLRRHQTPAIQ